MLASSIQTLTLFCCLVLGFHRVQYWGLFPSPLDGRGQTPGFKDPPKMIIFCIHKAVFEVLSAFLADSETSKLLHSSFPAKPKVRRCFGRGETALISGTCASTHYERVQERFLCANCALVFPTYSGAVPELRHRRPC